MKRAPVLLLLAFAAPSTGFGEPLRGPYLVRASSTAVKVCWRWGDSMEADACRRIKDLLPGTTFTYAIDNTTRSWTGRALPADDASVRFAVFGDAGTASPAQYRVAAQLELWKPDLVLLTGDIVYDKGKDKDYDRKYFRPYAGLLPSTPFFPSLGNHDYGNTWFAEKGKRTYKKNYQRIHRRSKYYSFDVGPAHFIALDDNEEGYNISGAASIAKDSRQWKWLKKDLEASTAKWKFVFLHVPLRTSYEHGNHEAVREAIEPLLARHGVQVVFAGHNHHYERLGPLGGLTHITAGTGGADLYQSGMRPFSEILLVSHGFVGAVLSGDSLTLTFIDDKGQVRDRYTIAQTARQPQKL